MDNSLRDLYNSLKLLEDNEIEDELKERYNNTIVQHLAMLRGTLDEFAEKVNDYALAHLLTPAKPFSTMIEQIDDMKYDIQTLNRKIDDLFINND
jgi:hypothetical protein